MDVKLSIGTPVVTMQPGTYGEWEVSATIDDIAQSPRPPIGSATTT